MHMLSDRVSLIGVVVIGRNEGERLKNCLSKLPKNIPLIYVDSGSSDGSAVYAKNLGIDVFELDQSCPFTAARARNVGWHLLTKKYPDISMIQFVDGDSELHEGWLNCAQKFLLATPSVAAVRGKLLELRAENSVYNRLCEFEWAAYVGEVEACGGIAMMRVSALASVHGFIDGLIAGEEPELCVRLRSNDWKIWCLDVQMGVHDADITSFNDWWNRTRRAGFAFSQVAALHWRSKEKYWVKEAFRAVFWAAFIPITLILLWVELGNFASLCLLIYPIQIARVALRLHGPFGFRLVRSFFLVLGKFAEFTGIVSFCMTAKKKKSSEQIEYK
jgi:glycosyltransferase involved in cell wall biosynthesis